MAITTINASDLNCFLRIEKDKTDYPLLSADEIWLAHMYPAANATTVSGKTGDAPDSMRIGQYKNLDDLTLCRHGYIFDGSSLTGEEANGATFKFFTIAPSSPHIAESGIHPSIVIVSGADIPDSGCVAATFGDLKDETISYGSILLEDCVNGQFAEIELNTAGIAVINNAIDGDGLIKFGLRISLDIDAHSTPYHDWTEGGDRADISGPSTGGVAPRLVLTHSTPSPPADPYGEGGYIWVEGTAGVGGYIWVEGAAGAGGYIWIE